MYDRRPYLFTATGEEEEELNSILEHHMTHYILCCNTYLNRYVTLDYIAYMYEHDCTHFVCRDL